MIVPDKFGFRIFFREQEFNFQMMHIYSFILMLENHIVDMP